MQGMLDDALAVASNQISNALACADRHTGLCTTFISLRMDAVRHSLRDILGQPGAFSSPSKLANVVCLEPVLYSHDARCDHTYHVGGLANRLFHRVPNLIAARFRYPSPFYELWELHMPFCQLKHLDVGEVLLGHLAGMHFAAVLPALETASISTLEVDAILELDVSGCQHLMQLVLSNVFVCRLSKPPQCRLRVDMSAWEPEDAEASQLQPGLSEVNEVLLHSRDICSPHGLVAAVGMPKVEVIRCDWSDYYWNYEDVGSVADALVHCLRHSRTFPAVKSILCGDYGHPLGYVMKVRIPAGLAGVQELIFATDRRLQLAFDSARTAGERLNTFCAVASEVSVDAEALLDMTDALLRRRLTLSMAQAGQEHENAPSQCMYVRAISAPQLSYDDAISAVNARVGKWGKNHDTCAECGACFKCLRKAGILDGR